MAIQDFRGCILRNGLINEGFVGHPFTWCNNRKGRNRIWERVDRLMSNLEAQTQFPQINITHLPLLSSDHSPLLVRLEAENLKMGSGFIFQRMWTDHPEFLNIVKMDWERPNNGVLGMTLHTKLARLKRTLSDWNWKTFGNIHSRKQVVQEKLNRLDSQLQHSWSEAICGEWEETRKELQQEKAWENELLCNKARLDWVKEGDINTKLGIT